MYDDLLLLENQICFRLYKTSRNMTRLYQPFLSEFNLTYPQYIVMLVMFEHEAIDFRALSKIVDLKTGTLTPIVQNLEKVGYLYKIQNPSDKRRINLEITKMGRDLKQKVIDVPLKITALLPMVEEKYKLLAKELDALNTLIDTSANKKAKHE